MADRTQFARSLADTECCDSEVNGGGLGSDGRGVFRRRARVVPPPEPQLKDGAGISNPNQKSEQGEVLC